MARTSDEIDYELIGDDLQAVIVTLDPGETVIAEAGAMMFMEQGIEMNTTLDPNKQGGGMLGKLFQGAQARAVGRHLLHHDVHEQRARPSARRLLVALSRQDQAGGSAGVGRRRSSRRRIPSSARRRARNVDIAFTKRIGAGFFGGEGFILQRISGDGVAVLHASGALLGEDAAAGRDAARRHGLHRGDGAARAVRHPDGAGHQDGAVRRRGPVLRHAHRPGHA